MEKGGETKCHLFLWSSMILLRGIISTSFRNQLRLSFSSDVSQVES